MQIVSKEFLEKPKDNRGDKKNTRGSLKLLTPTANIKHSPTPG